LEAYLAREEADLSDAAQRHEALELLGEVSTRCASCHQSYRDPAGSR
jgi:cytochrome c556